MTSADQGRSPVLADRMADLVRQAGSRSTEPDVADRVLGEVSGRLDAVASEILGRLAAVEAVVHDHLAETETALREELSRGLGRLEEHTAAQAASDTGAQDRADETAGVVVLRMDEVSESITARVDHLSSELADFRADFASELDRVEASLGARIEDAALVVAEAVAAMLNRV